MLKAACVDVAQKHHDKEHRRRKKAEPEHSRNPRVEVREIIKKFKEPDYVADGGGAKTNDNGGFELLFSAVRLYDEEKPKIERPDGGDDYRDVVRADDFLNEHNKPGYHLKSAPFACRRRAAKLQLLL